MLKTLPFPEGYSLNLSLMIVSEPLLLELKDRTQLVVEPATWEEFWKTMEGHHRV